MRKLNKNNGITLIALIITIIVMLILVGVSISMVVNGGLFEYAGKAAKKTEDAKKEEEELATSGKIKVGDKWYATIDEYIYGAKWTQNETTVTKGDITLQVGQIVTGYDAKVEGWDGEWAVLGAEDGKLLLVSTKSVAYDSTNGYGTGTIQNTNSRDCLYNETLQEWVNDFATELAENVRPLEYEDIKHLSSDITVSTEEIPSNAVYLEEVLDENLCELFSPQEVTIFLSSKEIHTKKDDYYDMYGRVCIAKNPLRVCFLNMRGYLMGYTFPSSQTVEARAVITLKSSVNVDNSGNITL